MGAKRRTATEEFFHDLCRKQTAVRIEFANEQGKLYDGVLFLGSRMIYDSVNEKGVLGNHSVTDAAFVSIETDFGEDRRLIADGSVRIAGDGVIKIRRVLYLCRSLHS